MFWRVLNYIFVGLGVVFLLLIIAGVSFFITDPFNIKPYIYNDFISQEKFMMEASSKKDENKTFNPENEAVVKEEEVRTSNSETIVSPSKGQTELLESLGINPDSVPKNFTEEQISCFEKVLGQPRVEEIKQGQVPTVVELYKAKDCL